MTEFDMTKKDFVLITRIIGECNLPECDRNIIARKFGKELGRTNDRFNLDTFITACQKEIDKNPWGIS